MVYLVEFDATFGDQPNPRPIDGGARAVPADPYAALDDGQGAVIRDDLEGEDIRTLGLFDAGDEVFVESADPDDTDDETSAATRIWWRGTIVSEVGMMTVGEGDVN